MGFKKTLENVGKRVTGKGPEVVFGNTVEKYSKENGVTEDEARKIIFFENFDALSDEFHLTGSMEFDSKEYRNFWAGMRETFTESELETFKANSLLSTFPSIPVTISPREFAQMKKKFQDQFGGKNPNNAILKETAENIKEMRQLLSRISTYPGISTSPSMADLIVTHPEIADDFGRVLYLKEQIDSVHERFGDSVQFDKDVEGLKMQTKEIIGKSSFKEVGSFFKSMWTGTKLVSKGDFVGAMTHTTVAVARLATKTGLGALKLGFAGLKAGTSYAKKKIQ